MTQIIGIVGGVGPKAGEDLHAKILANTRASRDADHLPILLYTNPSIPDRTSYLLGEISQNPAHEIIASMRLLVGSGASLLCVPCNTAHAPAIWETVAAEMATFAPNVRLLNIIKITAAHIAHRFPDATRVGILATTGTITADVYQSALSRQYIQPIIPGPGTQRSVHQAIYHPHWGIKAASAPVSRQAVDVLTTAGSALISDGAEVLILGCTELPLALTGNALDGVPVIDPSRLLAREAILRAGGESRLAFNAI